MDKWKEIVLEWVNALEITSPVKKISDLIDESTNSGERSFFVRLLRMISENNKKVVVVENDPIGSVLSFLKYAYPNYSEPSELVQTIDQDELVFVVSLLMHYCAIGTTDARLRDNVCSRISKTAQVYIMNYIQTILKHGGAVTRTIVENAITEISAAINTKMNETIEITSPVRDVSPSPLKEFMSSPAARRQHQYEQLTREIRQLQRQLAQSLYEKQDLIDELKVMEEKLQKIQKGIQEKNQIIAKLKEELLEIANQQKTPVKSCGDSTTKLRSDLALAQERIQQLMEQLLDKENVNSSLNYKLKNTEQQRLLLEKQAQEYEEENGQLVTLSQSQAEQIESFRSQVQELQEMLKEYTSSNRLNMSAEMDISGVGCFSPGTGPERMDVVIDLQLKEKDDKIQELGNEVLKMKSLISDKNVALEELQKEKNLLSQEYSSKTAELENEISVTTKKLKLLEETIQLIVNEYETKFAKLEEDLSVRNKQVTQLEEEKEAASLKYESKISDLENVITLKNRRVSELEQNEKVVVTEFEDKIAELDKIILEKSREIDNLEREKQMTISNFETKRIEADMTISNNNLEIEELNKKNSLLSVEYKTRTTILEGVIADKNEQLDKLEKNFELATREYQTKIKELEKNISNQNSLIENLETKLNELKTVYQTKSDELEKTISDKTKLEHNYKTASEEYKTKMLSLETVISEKDKQLQKLEEDKNSIVSRYDARLNEILSIVSDKNQEIDKLKNSENSCKSRYEIKINDLEQNIVKMEECISKLSNDKQILIREYETKIEQLNVKIVEYSNEVAKIRSSNEYLINKQSEEFESILNSKTEELTEIKTALNGEIRKLQEQIENLKTENSKITADLEKTIEKNTKTIKQLNEQIRTYDEMSSKCSSDYKLLQERFDALTEENKNLYGRVAHLTSCAVDKDKIVDEYEIRLKEQESIINEVTKLHSEWTIKLKSFEKDLTDPGLETVIEEPELIKNKPAFECLEFNKLSKFQMSHRQAIAVFDKLIVKKNNDVVRLTEEIRILNTDISKLKNEIDETASKLTDAVNEIQMLHKTTIAKESDYSQLVKDKEIMIQKLSFEKIELENGIERLTADKELLLSKIESMKKVLDKTEQSNNDHNTKALKERSELERMCQKYQSLVVSLEQSLDALVLESDRIRDKLKESEECQIELLHKHDEEIKNKDTVISELEKQTKRLIEQVRNYESDLAGNVEEINALKSEIKNYVESLKVVSEEHENKLIEMKVEFENRIQEKINEIVEHSQKLAESTIALNALKEEKVALNNDWEEMNRNIINLTAERDKAIEKYAQVVAENERQMKEKLQKETEKLLQCEKEKTEQFSKLYQKIEQLSNENSKLRFTNEMKQESISSQLEMLNFKIDELSIENQTLKQMERSKLISNAELNKLREAYEKVVCENSQVQLDCQMLRKQLTDRSNQLLEVSAIKDAYNKVLEENYKLKEEVKLIKQKRAQEKEEFKKMEQSNANVNSKILEVRSEYDLKLEKIKSKMKQLYADEVERIKKKKIEEMNQVCRNYMEKLAQSEGHANELRAQLWSIGSRLIDEKKDKEWLKTQLENLASYSNRLLLPSNALANRDSILLSSRESLVSTGSGRESIFLEQANRLNAPLDASFGLRETAIPVKEPLSVALNENTNVALSRRTRELPRTSVAIIKNNTEKVEIADSRRNREPDDVIAIKDTNTYTKRHTARNPASGIGQGLHMEDEEGEVFNNTYLTDMKEGRCVVPKSKGAKDSVLSTKSGRLSELQRRNSLYPPHLKSSYPAETQLYSPGHFKEEDIKVGSNDMNDSMKAALLPGEKSKRKDHGQTIYKKPGPPTPTKNGGRLSLQGNETHPREVLREQNENMRKSATPSRLKALFLGNRSNTRVADSENQPVTPRGRRLSIFRKQR